MVSVLTSRPRAEEAPSSKTEEVEREYEQAAACYRKALHLKEDMYDPIISLANLEFERGKLAMDLAIASPTCALVWAPAELLNSVTASSSS